MAQNVTIAGASFQAVPALLIPLTGGGGNAQFTDVSDTTAAAADVASGKYFYTASGVKTAGTASGGGGSGLVYETGTYTPTSDIARPVIDFSGTHSERPFCIIFVYAGTLSSFSNSTNLGFYYTSSYDVWGLFGNGSSFYGLEAGTYVNTSGSQTNTRNALTSIGTDDNTTQTTLAAYATSEHFRPFTGSTSRYWRKDYPYKWIAVWKP